MKLFCLLLFLAALCLGSPARADGVHGLGGEGYSLWKGNEEAPAHNCEDHNHAKEGTHIHQDVAKGHHHEHDHSHDAYSHGAHSHGHPHSDHSHGDQPGGGHPHGGHSHGSHSHGAHSHQDGSDDRPKSLEELEAEEMATYGFSAASQEDFMPLPSTWERWTGGLRQSSWGTWTMAMGSSLAVSLCSLICLIILPFILKEGQTPSEGVVRILTGFGAGAMVGDAFLHQLPHAFNSGGAHSHVAESHGGHSHDHGHEGHGHDHGSGGHAHSIQDLSVGLAVLVGLIVFFLVEKAVRYVEEATARNPEIAKQISFQKQHSHAHGHKGHSHSEKSETHKKDESTDTKEETPIAGQKTPVKSESAPAKEKTEKLAKAEKGPKEKALKSEVQTTEGSQGEGLVKPVVTPGSLLVLGYLNLFSDGVHNFTDGMALGAAFVHHGAVGGWSRTMFMLAHELPQEVGDFGILVRAGFSVTRALALNFLSASMAMAGTALALIVGGDASNSSMIEGFTAGGFVYIAVAGVMPDLHAQGTDGWITLQQVSSMLAGMGVALGISLWE